MNKQYIPQFKLDNFTCPICGVYAHQIWQEILHEKYDPTEDLTGLLKNSSGLKKHSLFLYLEDLVQYIFHVANIVNKHHYG